jgi:hypothetical protein
MITNKTDERWGIGKCGMKKLQDGILFVVETKEPLLSRGSL